MEIEASGKSDIGQFREINEDYFYVDNTTAVVVRIVDVDDFKLNSRRIRLERKQAHDTVTMGNGPEPSQTG